MTSSPIDPEGPVAVVRRLHAAVNARDIEAIVACFAADYRNETPVHPARSFHGRDQVRRNWTQLLGAVRDLHAEVLSVALDGACVWSELSHRGTRPDGSLHDMRGVVRFTIDHDLISHAVFYLEPVDHSDDDVNAALRRQLRTAEAS